MVNRYRDIVLIFVARSAHWQGKRELFGGADDLADVRDFPSQPIGKL